MKNFFYGALAAVVVVVGVTVLVKHAAAPAVDQSQVLGSNFHANQFDPSYFYNGMYVSGGPAGGKFDKMSNSSTTPTTTLASLAVAGHLTIGTGQTVESASTTAITASSDRVAVQLEQTTPIAGVTCNTTLNASSSEATTVFASTTNTTLNGFTINVGSAPLVNPFCYSYSITHGY